MKKTNTYQNHQLAALSLAALNAVSSQNVAILVGEITNADNGLVQLLPAGEFKAVDGRPEDVKGGHWLLDEVAFQSLKTNTPHKTNDLVIDFEHQTLKTEQNGKPAPAAGFFHIDDLVFDAQKGLFIKPRWTDEAKAMLNAGQYKYISAVFGYDTTTGRPLYLHSAGLTNRPGLDGMEPLAKLAANISIQTNQEDNAMNEQLLALLRALGIIDADGQLPDDTAALTALIKKAVVALTALQADAKKVPGLTSELAQLKADSEKVIFDPSKHISIGAYDALKAELATNQGKTNEQRVAALVAEGLADGRLHKSQKNWATELGAEDISKLEGYLENAPVITALKSNQTDGNPPKDDTTPTALSAEDKAVAKQLGISDEEFAKQKQELGA